MIPFEHFHQRALERHGAETLRARLPPVRPPEALRATGDDRYLAQMTRFVFSAGFRWHVIQAKWDGFEAAFSGFAPGVVADLGADEVDALAQDERIVRNRPKILATVDNARFVRDTAADHGSFGAWLAAWPTSDIVGLWAALKKGGNRLGGATGPWFLREVGKDTFRVSRDVTAALIEAGVVDKEPTGKRALAAAQEAFNTWAEQSGLPLAHISTILACSTGAVY